MPNAWMASPKRDVISRTLILFLGAVAVFSYIIDGTTGLFFCLLAVSGALFISKDAVVSVIGLSLFVNYLIIVLAFVSESGRVSYLWDPSFDFYYQKSIFLEILFWCSFILISKNGDIVNRSGDLNLPHNYIAFLFISLPLLLTDMILNRSYYFISYTELSSTGTVGYEFGAALLAVAIFLRTGRRVKTIYFILEIFAVLLVLYIALGSGKRLPVAYPIFAYTLILYQRYGRIIAGGIYFIIALGGYIFGIIRDTMVAQSLSNEALFSALRATNQGATLHASATYIRMVDEGLVTAAERLTSFVSNFFLSIFLPMGSLPVVARVNEFAMSFYDIQGNGGLIGSYSYFFLGWIGPIIIGGALAFLCRSKRTAPIFLFSALAIVHARWTLYNIGPAVRVTAVIALIAGAVFLLQNFGRTKLAPSKS